MNHTHTLLTCLLERANNSIKRTDIPLSPSVSRLPQTSEYYSPHPTKWDRTGIVLEVRQFDQYVVRVDGSGSVTLRNRKYLRLYTPHIARSPLIYSPSVIPIVTTGPPAPTQPDAPTPLSPPQPGLEAHETAHSRLQAGLLHPCLQVPTPALSDTDPELLPNDHAITARLAEPMISQPTGLMYIHTRLFIVEDVFNDFF